MTTTNETPREHVANAMQILVGAEPASPGGTTVVTMSAGDIEAVDRRLRLALAHLDAEKRWMVAMDTAFTDLCDILGWDHSNEWAEIVEEVRRRLATSTEAE